MTLDARQSLHPVTGNPLAFVGLFMLAGALGGFFVLNPLVASLFWLEFSGLAGIPGQYGEFIIGRMGQMLDPGQLRFGSIFACIGAAMGAGFGLFAWILMRRSTDIRTLTDTLAQSIPDLIAGGESNRVEFKSTLRWDVVKDSPNKALETVIAKTIVGFLNRSGGNLLIGVEDDGAIYGLEKDYQSLRRKDRDGFEQALMDVVKRFAGGETCALVHVLFSKLENKDVALVIVEPAHRPVYLTHGGKAEFYLRTGNSTRALDARETMDYAEKHWAK
ncbi:ATP-binding protein [Tropicimonas sp. TH_r6]|uniref:AlbA family DNA-binding domain-containing protein n=1 Tax=Tropicimonas sp. TH_r6 TaxID=3082085 RepID=UPI0029556E4C|nr:ATP-binding protein [Tropicimonas sp. TH_r6]MDV7144661.1 ATP-binding protein [Tropicimonas sp. TH_r6]